MCGLTALPVEPTWPIRREPLILLHGAYMTADMMGPLLTGLEAGRQVIVPELEGHGRTALTDRNWLGAGSTSTLCASSSGDDRKTRNASIRTAPEMLPSPKV